MQLFSYIPSANLWLDENGEHRAGEFVNNSAGITKLEEFEERIPLINIDGHLLRVVSCEYDLLGHFMFEVDDQVSPADERRAQACFA